MMTKENYEERKEAKIEYARDRASKLRSSSNAIFNRGFGEDVTGIPFGQPILVGHHSERRHRNAIKRMDNQMRKAIEDGEKADYYLNKAMRMEENTAISSDDPSAIDLLKAKVEKLELQREKIKTQNKNLRKENKDTHPSWVLSNLGQNIRSIKLRIQRLEKEATREHKEYEINGVKVIENTEENRIQLFFDGIPSIETRGKLKGHGFRWSRYGGCWQRMLNNQSIWATKTILDSLVV